MKVVLELLEQSSNIRRVTVRHDIVIGRGSDCNLRVSAPQVSRRHCFLRIDGNTVAVTDLESCNGTWLDGQKTVPGKRYFLHDGMQLAIGPVRFVARISGDEGVATPQADTPTAAVAGTDEPTVQATPEKPAEMDFSIEHAGHAAEQDEPTVSYKGKEPEPELIEAELIEPEVIELDEIEVIDEIELIDDGSESAEVILLDEATDIIDRDIAVEAVQLAEAVEVIDDNIDSRELLVAEEVFDDEDDDDELRDFLQDDE